MKKLVTFDAAGTLVRVSWQPAKFACECAEELGLNLPMDAGPAYDKLLRSRWKAYCEINLTRSEEKGDEFWRQLTEDWLSEIQNDAAATANMIELARVKLYGPNSPVFQLFDDVLPALDLVEKAGVRIAVISNWDFSLHRILKSLGIYERFEKVFASLEEGPEKPDPRLFNIVLSQLGVEAVDALHIGDDAIDDLQGARGVGMSAALIDRSRPDADRPYISSLTQVVEALAW